MRDPADLPPDERTDQLVAWMFGETLTPVMFRNLLPVVRSWSPAVVIHDTMEFAAPIAARAVGAVNVAHAYGPVALEHRMFSIAASVTPLWQAVDSDPPPYAGIYDHLYLDIYPSSLQPSVGSHVLRRQPLRPVPYAPRAISPLRPWPTTVAHSSTRPSAPSCQTNGR